MAGLVLAMLGCLALAARPSSLPMIGVEVLLTLVGIGVGTVLPVTTVAIQNAVPMHQLGTATGVMAFFRALGGAVAVAGFGALVLGDASRTASVTLVGEPDAVFTRLFITAAAGLLASFAWLSLMPERPLRSSMSEPTRPAAASGEV